MKVSLCIVAFISLLVANHCKPRCCGCPTVNTARIKALLSTFQRLIIAREPENALQLTTTNSTALMVGELCPNDVGCCSSLMPMMAYVTIPPSSNTTFYNEGVCRLRNGTYVTEYTQLLWDMNRASMAFKTKAFWIETEGCNYKIDFVDALSYACFGNVTIFPCAECSDP